MLINVFKFFFWLGMFFSLILLILVYILVYQLEFIRVWLWFVDRQGGIDKDVSFWFLVVFLLRELFYCIEIGNSVQVDELGFQRL